MTALRVTFPCSLRADFPENQTIYRTVQDAALKPFLNYKVKSGLWQVSHMKFRVFFGKEWDPEPCYGDSWMDSDEAGNLEAPRHFDTILDCGRSLPSVPAETRLLSCEDSEIISRGEAALRGRPTLTKTQPTTSHCSTNSREQVQSLHRRKQPVLQTNYQILIMYITRNLGTTCSSVF